MIKEAIDRILGLAEVKELTIDGRKYTSRELRPVHEPQLETIKVHTLNALCDYIHAAFDKWPNDTAPIIHIIDYANVRVLSPEFGPFRQRDLYVHASPVETEIFRFGHFLEHEEFIIKLQSLFVPNETIGNILKVVGNVKDKLVKTLTDDGISQTVTSKTGIAKVEEIQVPNPVRLAPWRTFPELTQPESDFIFRMRSGAKDGELPTCALFEADGGRWKIEAIRTILEYLVKHLPTEQIILA